MAELTRGQKRSAAELHARKAFRSGQTAATWIKDMKRAGFSYRRTDMLSNWRDINNLERTKNALQFVRRDYYPSAKTMAFVSRKLSHEFMYVLKVQSRLEPGQPITERNINIMSDALLTRGEAEELGWEMIGEQSPEKQKLVERIIGMQVARRFVK